MKKLFSSDEEKQQAIAQRNIELENEKRRAVHLSYPIKFFSGVSVANIVGLGLGYGLDIDEPEHILDLKDPHFLFQQISAVLASLPFFAVYDFVIIAVHNWKITIAREQYDISDEMITEAKGKLDGFKYIEMKGFMQELSKFLAVTAPLFLAFIYSLTAIMLIKNAIADFALLFGLTNFITLIQMVFLHVANVHPSLATFLQFDLGLFGIALSSLLTGYININFNNFDQVAHLLMPIFLPAVLGASLSFIPGLLDSIGSWLSTKENTQRIAEDKPVTSGLSRLMLSGLFQCNTEVSPAPTDTIEIITDERTPLINSPQTQTDSLSLETNANNPETNLVNEHVSIRQYGSIKDKARIENMASSPINPLTDNKILTQGLTELEATIDYVPLGETPKQYSINQP
jgi:hypothetical protein